MWNCFKKIAKMIEESERLKTSLEGKADHLADKLVPYTLLGTGLTYLLTRNTTKALSVLVVDFSCALKLAMPIAACLEVHFPHSMAKMVVDADKVCVHGYCSEVLPEDKAEFIEKEKASGRKVAMIGDRINDSPALSAADAGNAISDGLMKQIHKNYHIIVGFNSGLILLGIGDLIQPTASAMLHNVSMLGIHQRYGYICYAYAAQFAFLWEARENMHESIRICIDNLFQNVV